MKIIDEQLISGVVEQAKNSPRQRMNYNFHESLQDKCHRFLNALEPGTFIPVHHHPDKDETFVILKGKVRVTTYKDDGKILASCVIGQESGTYGVDIPKNVWHGLECLTPAVLLECKAGPFIEHEVDGILEIKNGKDIFLAGGCFWGTEHYFKQIEGVVETEVGFANGHTTDPSYKEVYTDTTGYAETVHVKYNPNVVSLEFLLQMFFKAIDPTSLNKQGHDEGTRYRTGIYYTNAEDLPVIEKVFAEEQQNYQQPLAVEKLPLQNFYSAEEYHQDYLDKGGTCDVDNIVGGYHPTGYCHLPESLFEYARKAKEMSIEQELVLHKKSFQELTVDELYELLRVRSEVFVVEQDCVYQDMDGDDQKSIHLWLTVADKVVALARVCPAGTHMKEISIGRVITTIRGKGYGKQIMLYAIDVAKEHFDAKLIDIEAQKYAKGFYESVGFRQSSDTFMLDGIPHIKMTLNIE